MVSGKWSDASQFSNEQDLVGLYAVMNECMNSFVNNTKYKRDTKPLTGALNSKQLQ